MDIYILGIKWFFKQLILMIRKNTAVSTPFKIATVIFTQSYLSVYLYLSSGLNMVLTLKDAYSKVWFTFMLGNDFRKSYAG